MVVLKAQTMVNQMAAQMEWMKVAMLVEWLVALKVDWTAKTREHG